MVKYTKVIAVLSAAMVTMTSFSLPSSVQAADSAAPKVQEARLINDKDIELYWDQSVTGAGLGNDKNFSITVDGKDDPIYSYTWEEYNYSENGIVYYENEGKYKTSIRLENPVKDLTKIPEIKVNIKANSVKGKSGKYAEAQTITMDQDDYIPFYQKKRTLDCGVQVWGTAQVRDEAMDKAAEMLGVMLSKDALAKRMGELGCILGVYGEGEIAYDIPEHRYTYDENYLYVEGFGGTQLASIREANVLRLRTGSYQTGYPNESVLTHEFGHTVKNYGLTEAQQREWTNIYNTSTKAGKWANTYAGSNEDEYFATLSAMWFNVMDDTMDGKVDGVRGPINTRSELKLYDRAAYDFLAKIYPEDKYYSDPWSNGSVPNNYDYVKAMGGDGEDTDFSKLKEAITEAEALKEADYTAETWKTLADALTAAKEAAAKTDAAQTEVDAAAEALASAKAALEKAEPTPAPADFTKLNETITAAEALKAEDYTEASWKPFEEALAAAKEAAAKTDAAQTEVDAAAEALTNAKAALQKKEPTPTPAPTNEVVNADGSKTTTEPKTHADGSAAKTETTTAKDGSVIEKKMTAQNGTVTGIEVTAKKAGKVTVTISYKVDGSEATLSKVTSSAKSLTIENTVTASGKSFKIAAIGANAFKGNTKLAKITLGKNVTSIGKNAFKNAKKLKTIIIKGRLTKVAKNAFKGIKKKATFRIKANKKTYKKIVKLLRKNGKAPNPKYKRN